MKFVVMNGKNVILIHFQVPMVFIEEITPLKSSNKITIPQEYPLKILYNRENVLSVLCDMNYDPEMCSSFAARTAGGGMQGSVSQCCD
jgi:putative transposon-encoded protein